MNTHKAILLLSAAILTTLSGCVKPEPTPPPTPPEVKVTSVTVTPATLSLVEGESQDLKAAVLPSNATNPKVTWTSSDTQVATVTDGTVKAVKPGTATITATADGKQGTCTVTVTAKPIPVSSVGLNMTRIQIAPEESEHLFATVLPENATDKSVSWESSDPSVATVDQNGTVTAVKPGTATVTVTTNDGGKTAICEVTVIIRVVSVSLDRSQAEIGVGESIGLVATVLPEDASDKSIVWGTASPDVATVDQDGKVTALKAGTAMIVATTNEGSKVATCNVTVINRVSSVSLAPTTLTLKVGGTATLTATVLPEDAKYKSVTWSSSAPDVVSVDQSGKVTALKPGTASVTVKTDEGGKTAVCEITVQAAGGGAENYGNGGNYGNNDF